ncbi:hypothetical protein [Cellulomonas xylanilytica]|uniref:Uncharacterized protein n=1 Tax=Cellulomonas xylanilytica TaxID=233583 RepID=A0A510VDC0_9CELL|nr:hypothetical protein [Cellulomonas xylanilytica]GEK23135.1 hypothetical protein CXY01_36550 [Cellulomonas xylanilytica]
MTTTATSATTFLDDVDLGGKRLFALAVPAGAPVDPAPQKDNTESGTVVGNSLVSFSALVSAQHKDDLNNSLALAQLMAVKEGNDPVNNPIAYYQYVATFLQQIGYTGQGVTFGDYTATTASVEIDKVVLEILGSIVAPAALGIVEAAVKALKSSADSGGAPWKIYDQHSTTNGAGAFSVGLANETNGSVALQVSAFSFAGTATTTKFLWMTYSATSVEIKDGSTTLSLNDVIYAKIRADVQDRLGTHAIGYIANLPSL